MRFYEFSHIKTIKPLSPSQARLHKLKHSAELAKAAVKSERAAQKRQKAIAKQSKQSSKERPINNPNQTL
jgi:hypothetical protein